jgi:hypothetical protein
VRFEDSTERREALQIALWWVEGALRTLDAVVDSLVGIKATRLERRRTEVLVGREWSSSRGSRMAQPLNHITCRFFDGHHGKTPVTGWEFIAAKALRNG